MNETLGIGVAFTTGVLLGAFFFGGLWLTVKKVVAAKRAALWLFGSLMLRTSIVLVGFYFVAHDHWQRLLVSLFGFIIARFIIMRFKLQSVNLTNVKQESGNAP